ncbi:MAG TPA: bifunctional lysylphosphatidylglycerol flippase/synthetase MprF [Thermoanaerobaculia bacterium]|nr:bifunctional lysylphosphatidylglycerol flippase/synthetase MprF [Thermoanaerobaculia bacterium]
MAAARPSLRKLAPVFSILFFGVALWLMRGELQDFRYREVVDFLDALPRVRLFEAFALTALGYLALTGYDTLALRYSGIKLPYPKVAFASFTASSFSNTLGYPLFTGTPLRVRLYSGWGLSALDVTRVVTFSFLTFWLGVLTLAGVTFVIEPHAVEQVLHLQVWAARALGGAFLGLLAGYVVFNSRRKRPLAFRGVELVLPGPELALGQIVIASFDWALAGAALYALVPDSWGINFPSFLAIFLLAQVAGLVSQVPGGLGVFESLMILLLPNELPRQQILGCLVAFRAIYYFCPLIASTVLLAAHEVMGRREQLGRVARFFGRRAPSVVPQVLAATTFLGGAILLISGSTPAVGSRLSWLNALLPLPVIEVSHFVGSLAGVGLLFLAAGLQRRLDAAYQLTVILLGTGIVVSLLKGLDYEEAILLSLMLASLIPCRRHFYRRASLTSEPFTPRWITAISVVIFGSLWLGFFAYKRFDYSNDLWWQFNLRRVGNASRFLRAGVAVLGVALAVALERLMRPAAPEPSLPTPADLDVAAAIAARSRRTYAYLALLGDKEVLVNEAKTAFVMYGIMRRSWVAMGDPVGPEEDRIDLAWRFRELSDQHGGWPVFYQVGERDLYLYADLGLTLLKLGQEGRVPLPDFSLEGRERKTLRWAHRKSMNEGYRFEVVAESAVPPLLPEIRQISDAWLAEKSVREKGFSLGYYDEAYLKRFPLALIKKDDRIVAFANLWRGAEQEEISIDLMRHLPDVGSIVMDYLFLELMLLGKAEGFRWFNLGMAPLSGLENRALAPLWSRLGSMVFRHGEHFYNFQGLRQYKEKFDPVWSPRYLATPAGLVMPRVLTDVAALIARGLGGVVRR